jgi:hypothetical protein
MRRKRENGDPVAVDANLVADLVEAAHVAKMREALEKIAKYRYAPGDREHSRKQIEALALWAKEALE